MTPDPEIGGPAGGPGASRARPFVILGNRRRFLVAGRHQLRGGALATSIVLALLILLNVALHASRVTGSAQLVAESPELAPLVAAQNRDEGVVVALASIVVLAGVFAVSILETLKSAGAAVAIDQCLARIESGHYTTTVRLRRGDNLQNLRGAVNRLSRTLTSRTEEEVAELEALASEAEAVRDVADGARLAARLRAAADVRRRRIG